ncbi:MAG: phosphate signaling complex PhoU family protein, partial [Acidimicrobiales bacterium]
MDELRRSYHDRIAELHAQTIAIVTDAADALRNVTNAFVDNDLDAGRAAATDAGEATARVPAVEVEVLDLLAQQAPVARDLRLILAALRIAQIGELCLGLVGALGHRVGAGDQVLTPSLQDLIQQIGALAADLLDRAGRA